MTFADPPDDPWLRASAVELLAALRSGAVTASELLETVLRRADEISGPVNPFAVRMDSAARRAAAESDRRIAAGTARPLEGLPVSAKDSQWLAGVPTTSGSRARADFVPSATVGALQRVLDAGAVVYAKTTTSEFCYAGTSTAPTFGTTANPHDLTRSAGGSSGGAAAATAAWAGPVGLGGDGGGSIRIPAAFCGLVGHKPTFGLVPHEPSGPGWKTLIVVGPLTRTVADAELMMDVLAGPDVRDRHSVAGPRRTCGPGDEAGPLRVAVSEDLGFAAVDKDVAAAFAHAVDALADAGVQIVQADPGLAQLGGDLGDHRDRRGALGGGPRVRGSPRAVVRCGARLPGLRRVGLRRALRPGPVRAGAHPRRVRGVLRRDRRGRPVHPHRRLRRVPGRAGLSARIGGVEIDDVWRDWAPMLYDANLTGLPACTVPIGVPAPARRCRSAGSSSVRGCPTAGCCGSPGSLCRACPSRTGALTGSFHLDT